MPQNWTFPHSQKGGGKGERRRSRLIRNRLRTLQTDAGGPRCNGIPRKIRQLHRDSENQREIERGNGMHELGGTGSSRQKILRETVGQAQFAIAVPAGIEQIAHTMQALRKRDRTHYEGTARRADGLTSDGMFQLHGGLDSGSTDGGCNTNEKHSREETGRSWTQAQHA